MPQGIVYRPVSGQQGQGASTGTAQNFTKPTLSDGVTRADLKDQNYAQRITDAETKRRSKTPKSTVNLWAIYMRATEMPQTYRPPV